MAQPGRLRSTAAGVRSAPTVCYPCKHINGALTSRVQKSPKCLDEDYATWVVELLQVVGEVGEADLILRIRECYLTAQAIMAERFLS